MVKKLIFFLGISIALCGAAGRAQCQDGQTERILSFQSDIRVAPDGAVTVTETLTVYAANEQIRHGIYRDFPTRYQDRYGVKYNVGFSVQRVLRDNNPEAYHSESLSNGTRVYLGSSDAYVSPGIHVYSLTYATDRQIGFFKDFDELYWNVTGNGWAFVIESARAIVTLPRSVSGAVRSYEAYTGPSGAKGTDYTASIDGEGRAVFVSTKPLPPGHGLTIAVTWPKGHVVEPPLETKARYFVLDNAMIIIGLFGLALVIAYYLAVWSRFGRDPEKGTIIPLYRPPDDLTPQAMRYIMDMGYDQKVFGCAIINMAVKGFLTIHEDKGVYTLKATGKVVSSELSRDEQELFRTLLSFSMIELRNTEHSTVSAAIRSLKFNLRAAYEKTYFLTNIKYFIPGLAASAVFIMASAYIQAGPSLPIALFMSVWLTGWSFGTFFLLSMVVNAWRSYFGGRPRSAGLFGQAMSISLFSIPFCMGEIFGIGVFVFATSVTIVPLLLLLVAVNILFYHLLRAPTLAGRRLMDKIEGFRMYLATAEKDRLNTLYGPERTPELFERYLPYALALDVEHLWAEKFAARLQATDENGVAYHPAWYAGAAWSNFGAAGFASSLGNAVSQAVSSASQPPGSSSGSGGGGSSGGGGGGGGGGGW